MLADENVAHLVDNYKLFIAMSCCEARYGDISTFSINESFCNAKILDANNWKALHCHTNMKSVQQYGVEEISFHM